MESAVVRRTRPNPDRLPDDHFVEGYVEAKQIYHHERPPFVEKNQGSCRAGLRKSVTLRVTDDQQHGLPVEAEMICWSWSPQYTFCTIDIGGRRLIVKKDSSDRYCSYRSWLGPQKGFSYQPVAFGPWQKDPEDFEWPKIDLKTQHAIHVQTLSNTPRLGSSTMPDGRAQQNSMTNQYGPQQEWRPSDFPPTHPLNPSSARSTILGPEHVARQQYPQEHQQHIDTGNTSQAASPSIKDSPRPIQAKSRDIQVSSATVHHDSQHHVGMPIEKAPSSGPRHDVPSPKKQEEHSPNGPCEIEQVSPSQGVSKMSTEIQEDSCVTSKPNEDSTMGPQKQIFAPAEPNDKRVFSKPPYENSADDRIAHGQQYQGQHFPEPKSLARPTKRRRQISIPNHLNPISPQLSTAMRSPSPRSSPRPTLSTSSQYHTRFPTPTSLNPQPIDSSSPLASHKQSRTTLFIAIPLSTDSVPLKLRSCMTLSSLFNSVLAICAQPGQDTVSGIRATFAWKQEKDVDRAILLKQDFPDTFEVFLEIIDGAPCWREEGGRCGVAVEVVLA
ncbi:MAG: hypothetical protein ALECFALPRED_002506 [Alectoria fallacina]|uniref:Uncharacterized protein n=1 Tax=Alectoria fallacina TaxID=1903189 RepID=A0A8H3FCS9_9LECA|nr:MAG: hypothetical protein ALECFALPRED_002506 [Alectoria fallacina]